jgi:hypothetical protein
MNVWRDAHLNSKRLGMAKAIMALNPGNAQRDTTSAFCGHRVCTAFIGDFGRPEVQPCWRRSRHLPSEYPTTIGSGRSFGREYCSAIRLNVVFRRRSTFGLIGIERRPCLQEP